MSFKTIISLEILNEQSNEQSLCHKMKMSKYVMSQNNLCSKLQDHLCNIFEIAHFCSLLLTFAHFAH